MDESETNLLSKPLFRYGIGVTSAAIVLAVAFFLIEDQTVRYLLVAVAASDLLVTPWILGRAAEQADPDAGAHDV